jgi:hypothetical protein
VILARVEPEFSFSTSMNKFGNFVRDQVKTIVCKSGNEQHR